MSIDTDVEVEDIARVVHEASRAWAIVQRDPQPPAGWDLASRWERESAVKAVRRSLDGASPAQVHDAWVVGRRREGWAHGLVKDSRAKTDPLLVAYDQLPTHVRRRDELITTIVSVLAADMPAAARPEPAPADTDEPPSPDGGHDPVSMVWESPGRPAVGEMVHYVSYGTPGGEYSSQCRAATVTEADPGDERRVGLAVLDPTGQLFHPLAGGGCLFAPHGGGQPALAGGTWHWPEHR